MPRLHRAECAHCANSSRVAKPQLEPGKNQRYGKKSDRDGVLATGRVLRGIKHGNLLGCAIA